MAKPIATEAAAPAAEPAPAAAAAPAPASSGWGEGFLAANRAAMAKATEAAKAEAEGGSKQAAATAPPVFSFGLPPPAAEAPAGDTPKLKQRLLEPQAEPPAAANPAAEAPVPAPAAPLFGFAKPAAESAQPQQATEPQAGLFSFGQPKSVAKQVAAEPGAPKFTFGGSRSSEADRQVAAAVASASAAAAAGPAPKFEFGGKAAAKQEAALTPPPVSNGRMWQSAVHASGLWAWRQLLLKPQAVKVLAGSLQFAPQAHSFLCHRCSLMYGCRLPSLRTLSRPIRRLLRQLSHRCPTLTCLTARSRLLPLPRLRVGVEVVL